MSTIGKRVRMFRMVQGFKQHELAARLGYSQSKVSRIEQDVQVPSSNELPVIARALRCLVTDLLPGLDDGPFQITVRPL